MYIYKVHLVLDRKVRACLSEHLLISNTKLSSKISCTLLYYYVDQQIGKTLKRFRKVNIFEFFC